MNIPYTYIGISTHVYLHPLSTIQKGAVDDSIQRLTTRYTMPDPDFDITSLSEEQQLALQQFTSVTDSELNAAVPLLQKCQWNAQIAITRFFDGDAHHKQD